MMIRPRKAYQRWLAGTALVLCLAIGALPHLGFLGAGWIPKLQAFQTYLLLFPVTVLVVGLLRKQWIISGIVLLMLLGATLPNLEPSTAAGQAGNGSSAMTVLSFNALKAGADPMQLAELIKATDPQVLVLVETSEPLHQQLASLGALDALGYRSQDAPAGGERDTVIFSKYPLRERPDELSAEKTGWYSLPVVDVEAPGGVVSVAGIHVYPPVGDAQRWSLGLEAVTDWAQQERGHPVILAGDFNSVRAHPGFRALTAGYAQADGIWPRPTWPADRKFLSLIGIDHIMARGASMTEFSVHAVESSDHLALSATVEILH